MNNYEECSTNENDSSFLYDFIKMIFVCGIGSIIASLFVSNHVWRPMIMSREEIKEAELELEEENKDVPYEERYPLSDSSEYADYEDISGSSGLSSEEDEHDEEDEEDQHNKESESDKDTTTSDEELIFELEKDEDSDEISSGELVEKPSDEEGEDKKEEKKKEADKNNIKKVAHEIINGMIETSVNTIKKEKRTI